MAEIILPQNGNRDRINVDFGPRWRAAKSDASKLLIGDGAKMTWRFTGLPCQRCNDRQPSGTCFRKSRWRERQSGLPSIRTPENGDWMKRFPSHQADHE